jgi:hypothetical protein
VVDKEFEISEVNSSSVFSFSRKDVLKHGLRRALEPSVEALKNNIEDNLVDLVDENLLEEGNQYQFILTVKNVAPVEDAPENEEVPSAE